MQTKILGLSILFFGLFSFVETTNAQAYSRTPNSVTEGDITIEWENTNGGGLVGNFSRLVVYSDSQTGDILYMSDCKNFPSDIADPLFVDSFAVTAGQVIQGIGVNTYSTIEQCNAETAVSSWNFEYWGDRNVIEVTSSAVSPTSTPPTDTGTKNLLIFSILWGAVFIGTYKLIDILT